MIEQLAGELCFIRLNKKKCVSSSTQAFYFDYLIFFVSPELSSVRDYVITHSVRSMYIVCMYVCSMYV